MTEIQDILYCTKIRTLSFFFINHLQDLHLYKNSFTETHTMKMCQADQSVRFCNRSIRQKKKTEPQI